MMPDSARPPAAADIPYFADMQLNPIRYPVCEFAQIVLGQQRDDDGLEKWKDICIGGGCGSSSMADSSIV